MEPEPRIYERPIPHDNIDPDAIKVLRRLARHGHTAYLVGGGVRDLLLDRHPKDFDIATSASPHEVRALFRNCRVIGRRFRLAHILFGGGKVIEVATFRKDPQPDVEEEDDDGAGDSSGDRRKPAREGGDLLIRHDNVFGEAHEDARRRDFTINGLFYDIERNVVIDYVRGIPDLEDRVVATIGDPDVRLREDPIRILRAIKFSARLDMGIDPDLYDAIVDHRAELRRAARPRVLEEVLRLLRGGASHRSMFLTYDTGVLAIILPELASYLDDSAPGAELVWGRLAAVDTLQARGELPTDAVLVGACLLDCANEWLDDGRDPLQMFEEFFSDIVTRLAVPRRLKDRVRSILVSQRRLRTGRVGSLARRDFYQEAAQLYALDCIARGKQPPLTEVEPDDREGDDEASLRRRRRRRRRR